MAESARKEVPFSELEAELVAAEAELVTAETDESRARSRTVAATNRVNVAQAAIERRIAEMKKAANPRSDWRRPPGQAVPRG